MTYLKLLTVNLFPVPVFNINTNTSDYIASTSAKHETLTLSNLYIIHGSARALGMD